MIPVYNGAQYLEKAIASALSQTLLPAEIAITNDASTDGTAGVIAKYQTHPLVRVQTLTERVIAPIAWNKAIRFSTAGYFVILAHDDLIHPTFLAEAEKALTESPETGLIVTGYRTIDEKDQVTSERPISPPALIGKTHFDNFFKDVVTRNMYFCDSGSVISRAGFEQTGGFDERFKGGLYDYDFFLRLAATVPAQGIAPSLADYRIHALNMSADVYRDDKGDADLMFSKMESYPFTDEQKCVLVRDLCSFQFQLFARAVRARQLSIKQLMTVRQNVTDRLNGWRTSANRFSGSVLKVPNIPRARLAWALGKSRLGIATLRLVTRLL